MTADDVQGIEREVGRSLPEAVRQFYLNYPPELRSTARDMGIDQDGNAYRECAADNELCDGADQLIAMNADGPNGLRPLNWNSNVLVVGCGGCGEVFWVDIADERGPVYCFESGQDATPIDPVAGSLREFAANLLAAYRAE